MQGAHTNSNMPLHAAIVCAFAAFLWCQWDCMHSTTDVLLLLLLLLSSPPSLLLPMMV